MRVKQPAVLLIALCCVLLCLPCRAQAGQKTVQELVMLFSAWSGDSDDRDIYQEAGKYIDYSAMAERALGKPNWDIISAAQKQEFVSVFQKLVEQRYYPRWHKIFFNGRVSYVGQTTVNGDTLVKSALQVGNEEDMVIWRLHPRNGELAVISLAVDETDLLSKVHDRFQKMLQKKGFANLLAWLKDEVEEDSDSDEKPEPDRKTGSSTASK